MSFSDDYGDESGSSKAVEKAPAAASPKSSEDGTGKDKYDQEGRRRQQEEEKQKHLEAVGGVKTDTSVDENSWDSEDEDPHLQNLKLKSISDPNKSIGKQNAKFGPGSTGKSNKDYES